MRKLLMPLIEALFRILFSYDCLGEEKLPRSGGAVVAANHPSYLDPILLSLQAERPIRFMAWDALFKVPVLGRLIRAFGAFPVDTRRGQGRAAYERARALVEAGEIVGIFPEGKRSRTGWMEPRLREGAARLALETGAPLFPATIAGAYRAWPHYQSLPRPARIRVRFHDPIDPTAYRGRPEEEAVEALVGELRERVDRSLLPGVKADLRMNVLYRQPAPFPRLHEWLPPMALALLVFWKTRLLLWAVPAYAYLAYLLLDHYFFPQRRLLKWLRNASPIFFLLAYAPTVLDVLGLPQVPAGAALASILCGAMFPYLYERGRVALAFIRDLTLAFGFALGALYLAPTGVGPHLSLPLFAAAFAWVGRTVFHAYTTPILVLYAAATGWLLGGPGLLPHVTAGLLAWAIGRAFPGGVARPLAEEGPSAGTSLGLFDDDEARIGAATPSGGAPTPTPDPPSRQRPSRRAHEPEPAGGILQLGLLDGTLSGEAPDPSPSASARPAANEKAKARRARPSRGGLIGLGLFDERDDDDR
jgi:1-acyl-sn-glycerol-3-phosphate acyltransferase